LEFLRIVGGDPVGLQAYHTEPSSTKVCRRPAPLT
jgi:hypothetical protein